MSRAVERIGGVASINATLSILLADGRVAVDHHGIESEDDGAADWLVFAEPDEERLREETRRRSVRDCND